MEWVAVVPEREIPPGTRHVSAVRDVEILLVNHQGQIYALDNRCPHMEARLEKGEITPDGAIVCPRHRSVFDLKTGVVLDWAPWPPVVGRALGAIRQERPVRVYPTKVEDGTVLVGIEDSG